MAEQNGPRSPPYLNRRPEIREDRGSGGKLFGPQDQRAGVGGGGPVVL